MSQQNRSKRNRRTHKSLFVRAIEAIIVVLVLFALYLTVSFAFDSYINELDRHDAAVQYFKVNGQMPTGYEE